MLSGHELEELLHEADKFKGCRIRVTEQISLDRRENYDHHHTTTSTFSMRVKMVVCAFSGMRLVFLGEEASYELFARHIDSYKIGEDSIEIIEHIEQNTMRRTYLEAQNE